jgi:plasmid stabilization system protein ParE
MRVSFHPEAFREVEEAQSWYENRSYLAAAGFLHELSIALRRVADAPHRYPVALHGTRRILMERFPFSVVFRSTDDQVVVVAIAHQKRRPGYWTSRSSL